MSLMQSSGVVTGSSRTVTTGRSALYQVSGTIGLIIVFASRCRCGYPRTHAGTPEQDNVLSVRKMEMSFVPSKRQSRWLVQAPWAAFSAFRTVVWCCLNYVQTHRDTGNKRLDTDFWRGTRNSAFSMYIWNYNLSQRWTEWHLVYCKSSWWKQIWGDFWPLTDHRSASINITERPTEGGHPTSIPQICFY